MSKKIMCGNVAIGGGAPVSIQSMCNTKTEDVKSTVAQIRELAGEGCQIIRLAVPTEEAVTGFGEAKKQLRAEGIDIPMVADIHFDYRLAIGAIKAGADKVRINPGNIGSRERVKEVADAAKAYGIPIRVGVNGGSLEKDILERDGSVTARGLADSALRNLALLEDMGFYDMVFSIKSSDVRMNFEACRLAASETEYPMHIGVTEAGTSEMGQIKSAAGIGALLLSGVGDTMRVSLTAPPVEEVRYAKKLLKAIGIRKGGIDFVSCPTCGRTAVDLRAMAEEAEKALKDIDESLGREGKSLKVAIMGCAVNGIGEGREADFGIAGGSGEAVLFSKGEILKKLPEKEAVEELKKIIEDSLVK